MEIKEARKIISEKPTQEKLAESMMKKSGEKPPSDSE